MPVKKPIRVLLVDDEERFLKTASATLKNRGFEVTAVPGGAEALKEIKKGEIDVVVLDVKMPGMDGNEVLQRIKGLKPKLEVIMLTGHGTMESALKGWHDEVYAYLTKPCDIEALTEKICDAFVHKKGLDSTVMYNIWSRDHS